MKRTRGFQISFFVLGAALQVGFTPRAQDAVKVVGLSITTCIEYARDVAVAGDYAYVAGEWRLEVCDVSNPANPRCVGRYDAGGLALGVAAAGPYAYLANDVLGLQVIDVLDPVDPRRAGGCKVGGAAQGVAISGHFAYVAAGASGLQVIDVSKPTEPRPVGACRTGGYALAVAVSGQQAYLADGPAGLQVIAISDPANPQRVGGYQTRGLALGVALAGQHASVADLRTGLVLVDISDPANPRRAGSCVTTDAAWGVAVSGPFAYVADWRGGLEVFDVSDPAFPRRAGGHSAVPDWFWTERVAVAGNRAYVVGSHSGLEICEITVLPPRIVLQPGNVVGYASNPVALSLSAGGAAMSYQWTRNGSDLAGATNSMLSFASLCSEDAGAYEVVVTNPGGRVTSKRATVVVNPPGVSLGWYAGLRVHGSVDRSYAVQRCADLRQPAGWSTLANLSMTEPEQFWLDPEPLTAAEQRFYRIGDFAPAGTGPPQLAIGIHPGLCFEAQAGRTFAIEYVLDLDQLTNWMALTNVTAVGPHDIWVDADVSAAAGMASRRYYRVTPQL